MGLFDDLIRFLETRLEEFLKTHPEIELQALEEQLRQQESDTLRLLQDSRGQEQVLQKSILSLGEEIKTWHFRIEKAQRANRPDLAQGAQRREAELLQKGSQLWNQMKTLKDKIQQMEALLPQIQQRRQEVKTKLQEVKAAQAQSANSQDFGFSSWGKPTEAWDDLEKQFHQLEVEEELRKLRQRKR
ncbi:MAG: TIGR04376 family protein [Thermostichus sp. DG02_5_bins_236]